MTTTTRRSTSGHKVMAALVATTLALAAPLGTTSGPAGAQSTLGAATTPVAPVEGLPGDLRLNQIQTIGSHNSFHIAPAPALIAIGSLFRPDMRLLDYTHSPLNRQFQSQGVRQIELDVYADSAGGRFAHPVLGPRPGPEMSRPGWKVLHINDIDHDTTCSTLVRCLQVVHAWSATQPRHLPIMIMIEVHDVDDLRAQAPDVANLFGTAPIEPSSVARMDSLDREIRSVFRDHEMVTPDQVRGGAATLRDGVLSHGWPTLDQSAGRVMFTLDNDAGSAVYRDYVSGRPSLQGRAMFTSSVPSAPDAAFMKVNGPSPGIADLVRQGFVVRTRADDTTMDTPPTTTRRDQALASGAQWVSTDYMVPGAAGRQFPGSNYVVDLPGSGVARCNPVSAATACAGSITIVQDSSPDAPQTFLYSTTGTGLDRFSLADRGDGADRRSFTGLAAGTYTVTQSVAMTAGWTFGGITCTTGETVDAAHRKVTITLSPGESTTCTFVDRKPS